MDSSRHGQRKELVAWQVGAGLRATCPVLRELVSGLGWLDAERLPGEGSAGSRPNSELGNPVPPRDAHGFLGRRAAPRERELRPARIFNAFRNAAAPISHPWREGPLELMTTRA